MKKLIIMILLFSTAQTYTMEATKQGEETGETLDVRKMYLNFPHNKRDKAGNTFWHQLALKSAKFTDWSQVNAEIGNFMANNNQWLPNPFITNNGGKTAYQL